MSARHLSEDLRDSPSLGSESIVYWLEHLLRHQGKMHSVREERATASETFRSLSVYQVDVIISIFLAFASLSGLLLLITVFILRRILTFSAPKSSGAKVRFSDAKKTDPTKEKST